MKPRSIDELKRMWEERQAQKKPVVSFRIDPAILKDFKATCKRLGLKPSFLLETYMTDFVESAPRKPR